ncbi:hypothetical protein GVN24_20170 [Rhizobium sp. CRIBSB]|nr:hypothetical protein [Rhizobium sp. CRIBSB]
MRSAVVALVLSSLTAGSCLAQTYGQPGYQGAAPAYVSPRLPMGYAALGQGHATYSPGSGAYLAPRLDYLSGARLEIVAAPVAVTPTQVYVVIPDIRVLPSPVIVEPPQVHFIPGPAANAEAVRPETTEAPPATGTDH